MAWEAEESKEEEENVEKEAVVAAKPESQQQDTKSLATSGNDADDSCLEIGRSGFRIRSDIGRVRIQIQPLRTNRIRIHEVF